MPKYLFFIIILFGLTACAGRVAPPVDPLGYALEGKLAFRTGDVSRSANFRWRQAGNRYDVEMWGLLGQGRTQFQGDSAELTVLRGGEILAQGAPEQIMQAQLGYSLPLSVLAGWLQGEPSPTASNLARDEQGNVLSFSEAQWEV